MKDMEALLAARTEEEEEGTISQEVMRKRQPGGWKTMPFVIGNETFERVATFGLTANFTVFLVRHFNMPEVAATNLTNIWSGTTNIAPLIGAFLSDAYWGKFKTLAVGSIATLLGMIAMTLTTFVRDPGQQSCNIEMKKMGQCMDPGWEQISLLIMALVFLTLGAAGIRPCSLPFGMDQFDRTNEKGTREMNSFFNWYYATNNAATVLALTVVVYIQDHSWRWGLCTPTILMLLATILFFLGTRLYIYVTPEGSIFSSIVQVVVAAYKKRSMKLPSPAEQESTLYNPPLAGNNLVDSLPLTKQFSFLNKAAIELDGEVNPKDGLAVNPWNLCSIQQVEELKCLIRIVPIWASGITCFVAMAQQWGFAVLQALKMDRKLGSSFQIPPGSLGAVSLVSIVIFLILYDQLIVPALRRVTKKVGGITLLQRMGVGIFISALSMLLAGLVEVKRRSLALAEGGSKPMSVMWLVPQLALVGISEGFNAVGQIEFYNQQFPEQMRSIATSLFSCSLAGASYLSSILVALVQNYSGWNGGPNWLDNDIDKGRLDYFYYLLAAMGMMNLLYFLVSAHFYHYKGIQKAKDGYHHLI